MPDVFLATLGKRPEVVTIALDLLLDRYSFEFAVIMHTEPHRSGIADALTALRSVTDSDYPALTMRWQEIRGATGSPLLDIESRETAEDYFRAIYNILRTWSQDGYRLHLLIAGGRKAMSTYAMLAAGLVFRPRDRVWTVLSPDEMLAQGSIFHVPPGWRERVQLVDLPLLPACLSPDERAQLADPVALVAERRDIRRLLLKDLFSEERRLADLIAQKPTGTYEEYAAILGKSARTIENQVTAICNKLGQYMPEALSGAHKRMVLTDVLTGQQ